MLILAAVLLAAVVGVVYLIFAGKNSAKLNVERYQTSWLAIENSVSRQTPAGWQVAIMDADKLVDQALRERNVRGKTMGERLKSADKLWSNSHYIRGAHKVRNQVAHDVNVQVTYEITLRSLSAFKQALKDLGAI